MNIDSAPISETTDYPAIIQQKDQLIATFKEEISVLKEQYERIKRPRNNGGDTISFPDDLPVKRVELDIPECEKICPESGEPLVCIGHDVSRKLGRSPEQFFIVEYASIVIMNTP